MDPSNLNDELGLIRRSLEARSAPSLEEGKLVGMVLVGQIGEALVDLQTVGWYNEEHRPAPRKMQQGMRDVHAGLAQTRYSLHLCREVYALAHFYEFLWRIEEP